MANRNPGNKNQACGTGMVKISEDVIASVAAVAAGEIDGVKFVTGKKPASISKKANKYVKLTFTDSSVTVDVSIVVKYGYIIPEVGQAVQDNVQDCVESMTGLRVDAVNVHCTGIAFAKEAPQKPAK
ncbi:MAG: Asp23/Gls24 family envelope stress response protein [Clostridiales bacterium]|nr:MAG: Asp23/Gls24 family envelope stress response protein [Clostridiales bacterium]